MGSDPRIYVRVLRDIRERIESGELKPVDSQLTAPCVTINELCRKYSCTRQTVGKALKMLENDGLLKRVPGLGYFVAWE